MYELNKLLFSFVEESKINNVNNFIFPSKLAQIILDCQESIYIELNNPTVSLDRSLKYAKDFLSSLNEKYILELENKQNTVIFDAIKNGECKKAFSIYYSNENKKKIYIPYNSTLQDAFAITHEVVHATTMSSNMSMARNLFCEFLSFSAEMLQKDYFEINGIENFRINDIFQIISLYDINRINIFRTMLLSEFLEKGYINIYDFKEMISVFTLDDRSKICNYLYDNLNKHDFDLLYQNSYIIGYPLACYFYDCMGSNKEFVKLNDSINDYTVYEFFNHLNLNLKEELYIDLTDCSYQKIKESFAKRIKMIK